MLILKIKIEDDEKGYANIDDVTNNKELEKCSTNEYFIYAEIAALVEKYIKDNGVKNVK